MKTTVNQYVSVVFLFSEWQKNALKSTFTGVKSVDQNFKTLSPPNLIIIEMPVMMLNKLGYRTSVHRFSFSAKAEKEEINEKKLRSCRSLNILNGIQII